MSVIRGQAAGVARERADREAQPLVEPRPPRPAWPPAEPPPASGHVWVARATGLPGVVALTLVVGLLAWWFARRHDLLFLDQDARAHLAIAGRLVAGPDRGLGQLGTDWLPLPHLLLAPFAAVRSLWREGLAPLPVDLVCLAVETGAAFSIVRRLVRSRVAAWVAVLVLLTNPSLLAVHTTALAEPTLLAAMLLTVAALVRWADSEKPFSGGEMTVFCGLPATAMVLTRYDGWVLAAAATVLVAVVAWLRWRTWRYAVHIARCFATIPALAVAWWLWFGWVHAGDPFAVVRDTWSTRDRLLDQGRLPDANDLGGSVTTFTTAVTRGIGWVVVGGAVLGMVLWAVRGRGKPRALAPWLLVVVPFATFVVALWAGLVALQPDTAAGLLVNVRYGIVMLPGLAVFTGLGVGVVLGEHRLREHRHAAVAVAVAALVVVAVAAASWWPDWRSVPVVEEGLAQEVADGDRAVATTGSAASPEQEGRR